MEEPAAKRPKGRQPGALIAGSLAWQISRLDKGRYMLIHDDVAKQKLAITRAIAAGAAEHAASSV